MIIKDYKTSPFIRTALVKAKAAKARRNAKLATILVNVVGSLIGALCVVYSVHVVLG
jgi:fluoride ion exporter CrcB/FEX